MTTADPALTIGLEAAVPLWMAELRGQSYEQRQRIIRVWAADAAEVVAYYGDTLMFRTKPYQLRENQVSDGSRRKAGTVVSTADTFNHLARGLAALAYTPGGVLFAGVHWCVEHRWGIRLVEGLPALPCQAGDEPPPDQPANDRPIRTATVAGEVL